MKSRAVALVPLIVVGCWTSSDPTPGAQDATPGDIANEAIATETGGVIPTDMGVEIEFGA